VDNLNIYNYQNISYICICCWDLIVVSVNKTLFYLAILKIESIFAAETYCVYDTNMFSMFKYIHS